ncbi:type VI secretion system accessory protein TagJ [Cupriavidus sp. 2MCAB6]|uniref:type VI secretion system accessory protein TagJ n=1 Tax=Cupriavidus sp. 2MCAB6 TaxID=3232981 RepID=UPI003F90B41E
MAANNTTRAFGAIGSVLGEAGSIADALAATEAGVRKQPGSFDARWGLFQWLCVVGDWPRALRQLQVAAQLAPDFAQTAHAYRDLVRMEAFRKAVFSGAREPAYLLPAPGWLERLHVALALAEACDISGADRNRNLAFSDVSDTPGSHDGQPFAWITDTDTRLGPTCELVVAGRYTWLPFSQMRTLHMRAPAGLLDLLWRPATVTLVDGSIARGFIPVRYPDSELGRDAIRMARETTWSEAGETGVMGLGQKTWMTDAGDVPLLETAMLTLGGIHD